MSMWIGIGILGFLAIVIFGMYNTLIGKKNNVENSFGSIDALLKKRYDLIPNLVATVKQYMTHESETLTKVTEMRAKAASGKLSADETVELNSALGGMLGGIMVAVEDYPDLKANENFQQLQRTLNEIEEQLSASRRAYNAAVTDFNNAVEMFPTNIMAGMMNYKRRKLFEATEAERVTPDVKDLFSS